jgi:hypothetical protein
MPTFTHHAIPITHMIMFLYELVTMSIILLLVLLTAEPRNQSTSIVLTG